MNTSEKLWQRVHVNGWLTVATEEPDGSFRYSASTPLVPQANSSGRTSELARAQFCADNRAECTNCRCPGWKQVE